MAEKQRVTLLSSEPVSRISSVRTVRYIADMVGEMERMARRDGYEGLAISLRAARREADRLAGE